MGKIWTGREKRKNTKESDGEIRKGNKGREFRVGGDEVGRGNAMKRLCSVLCEIISQ